MNEFFTALYTENSSGNADTNAYPDPSSSMMSSFADLPLSSPDSITVTTEFGVLEETGNVTIISAGGATHPYDTTEDDDDQYDNGEQFQDMQEEDGQESYVVMTEDTSVSPDWVTAVALQHQQSQNSWLLAQQMHNMYNVAQGTNTTPPPVHTVAPVVHFQEGMSEDEDEDEQDTGEEADVDTDEVDVSATDGADGAATPTAPTHAPTHTQA